MILERITDKLVEMTPFVLSILRVVVGFLFFLYGTSHLFGWPSTSHLQPFGTLQWWAGVIELVCGGAIVIGFGTRLCAFIASGAMAFAYFAILQPRGLFPIQNNGDAAVLYSWIFLLLVFTGGGVISVDEALKRKFRSSE